MTGASIKLTLEQHACIIAQSSWRRTHQSAAKCAYLTSKVQLYASPVTCLENRTYNDQTPKQGEWS